jgi:hypothetical protein
VLGAPSIFETRGSELCYLLCDQTKGQKRLIADHGGTSNPPTIGRSTPAKRKGITMRESTQMANAFVRGANLVAIMTMFAALDVWIWVPRVNR